MQDAGSIDQVILDYLASIANLEDDRIQKRLLEELIREYVVLEKKVDGLLKNTLPETVANEIKYSGKFLPRPYDKISSFLSDYKKEDGQLIYRMLIYIRGWLLSHTQQADMEYADFLVKTGALEKIKLLEVTNDNSPIS